MTELKIITEYWLGDKQFKCSYCVEWFNEGKDNCKNCGFDMNIWNEEEEVLMDTKEKTIMNPTPLYIYLVDILRKLDEKLIVDDRNLLRKTFDIWKLKMNVKK